MTMLEPAAIGQPEERLDASDKVTGAARYAFEHAVDGVTYGWVVGATVASGRIRSIDVHSARSADGVLDVVSFENASRLTPTDDAELAVLQRPDIAYYGQPVAVVVGSTLEAAREGASALHIEYDESDHRTRLDPDDPHLYTPDTVNAGAPGVSSEGDAEQALAAAETVIDHVYETPPLHNLPMEPHATVARWEPDGSLTVWTTTQNVSEVAGTLGKLFGLDATQVDAHSEHVGGGFGSKGTTRPQEVLATLAARVAGRPVKIALTREMTFHLVGHRTPTRQRIRLGADSDGRLVAIAHETTEHTSQLVEFAEQTGESTRHMYAAPNRYITHRLARLNVPTPRWMRAPGECPGMYGLESAMDEMARAVGLDPIEFRVINEPPHDPATKRPFSSRHYVDCLREGALRFGWDQPYDNRTGDWWVGHGVAGSIYPALLQPSSARVQAHPDGSYDVAIAAADIGTGARTVLRQIAADALGVPVDRIRVHIGSSRLPRASVAGGSSGTASWGSAVTKACRTVRSRLGRADHIPPDGLEVIESTDDDVADRADLARYGFGAQFVEVHVHAVTGEVRVPRAVGVFAVGRIMNPRLARSQFIGGMTMGLGMALMEEGVVDHGVGDTMNDNYADYHIAANADIVNIEVSWLDEHDDQLTPMGGKGIGEIGIVGTAAAVTNAVYDATGVRVRDLPVRLDKLISSPDWRW